MRRFLVIVLLVALGAVAYLGREVFARYTAAFPELPPGVYVGTLRPNSKDTEAVPWLVARFSGEQSLSVSVGDVRLPSQIAAPIDPSGKTRLPLTIGEGEARVKFVGGAVSPTRYRGRYSNPRLQQEGEWVLSRVSSEETPSVVEQGLIRWFAVREEIERIEAEIQEIQSKADQQSSSIDNLHRYVADEDALRKTADDRLGRADSQLDAARAELTQRQGQLDKAIRDFELSQRISQEGKLVFLSRETIQRESRWIELSLKLVAPETSLGFDQALARAEKVRALKAAIRREREGVAATTGAERYSGRSAETRNEEEFYETLR